MLLIFLNLFISIKDTKAEMISSLSVVFPPVMIQHPDNFAPTALNMTFLLVPGPEALLTVLTPDREGQAVLQDEVFPQVSPAGETLLTLRAGLGFLHLELAQALRVVLLSVLDESPLGDETFPTVSAGKVSPSSVLSHVDLQVVRLGENFTTNLAGPQTFPSRSDLRLLLPIALCHVLLNHLMVRIVGEVFPTGWTL